MPGLSIQLMLVAAAAGAVIACALRPVFARIVERLALAGCVHRCCGHELHEVTDVTDVTDATHPFLRFVVVLGAQRAKAGGSGNARQRPSREM